MLFCSIFSFFSNKSNIDEFKNSDLCGKILKKYLKTITVDTICDSEFHYALHSLFITDAYQPYITFLTKELVNAKIIKPIAYNKHVFKEYVNNGDSIFKIAKNKLPYGCLWMFRRFIYFIFENPYGVENETKISAFTIKDAVLSYPTISHIFLLIIPEYVELHITYLLRKSAVLMIYEEMCNGFKRHPFADDYIIYNIVKHMHVKVHKKRFDTDGIPNSNSIENIKNFV